MNDIIKAMMERRSIRKFKPELPTKEEIDQVIEAGLWAASGKNQQAAIVVAITNKELRDKLAESNRQIAGLREGIDPFYGGQAILVVLANKDRTTYVNDGSLVIGNMLLAAHSLGLGAIWIHRAKEEFEMEEYRQILRDKGISDDWEGIGHCVLGYYDGEYPAPLARKEDRVYYVE